MLSGIGLFLVGFLLFALFLESLASGPRRSPAFAPAKTRRGK
jgi:hypothetical protein